MHAWKQIKETGKVKLFESHRTDFRNGEQLRDFIYVDDVTDICLYFFRSYKTASAGLNGIYNVGTGHARSFNDLAMAIFNAMGLAPQIEYIPTPIDIRDKYQYYTEAKMDKLKAAGYPKNFTSLTEGIRKYVEFLKK
jgi:ADP-L-glycero-D-manno-heptose 6-epimerase